MKLSKHTQIKILGGGIAGLSASIFLKKAGINPIIYEKNNSCGAGRHGDIEGLETWNFCPNSIDFLKLLDIPIDFKYKSENEIIIHFDNFPQLKILDNNPFFHFVQRGPNHGNIDRELQSYALSIGCEIRFGVTPEIDNIAIIATGANNAKAFIQMMEGPNNSFQKIVEINAGAAIYLSGIVHTLKEGVDKASQTINNGKTKDFFNKLTNRNE